MSNIDHSYLNKESLTELRQADLEDYIIDLAWSPDGEKLAVVTVEGAVFLFGNYGDTGKYKLIGQHAGGGNSVSWRSDGVEFATAGHDGQVKVWDGISGQEIIALSVGDLWVTKVIYNPSSKCLATAAVRCDKEP